MSSLRQRAKHDASTEYHDTTTESLDHATLTTGKKKVEVEEDGGRVISVLDIFRLIFLLIVASCALSYFVTGESFIWGYKRPWFTKAPELKAYLRGPLRLTPSQLARYDGSDPNLPIYVAINGTIYDVSRSPHMYGPGGGYSFFAGRDATRAFVTGCFREDLTDDLRGVEEMFVPIEDEEGHEDVPEAQRQRELEEAREKVRKTVEKWERFYAQNEKYFEVGKVVKEDSQEQKGPVRPLCEAAKKQRPKRSVLRRKQRDQKEKGK
ncbi:hypothetical protein VTO42DRAFT_5932 [Malbranchea cinnamomea]